MTDIAREAEAKYGVDDQITFMQTRLGAVYEGNVQFCALLHETLSIETIEREEEAALSKGIER